MMLPLSMLRFRFSMRTGLIALTVCCAVLAFGFTTTNHKIDGQWDGQGAMATAQIYPGDHVNIFYEPKPNDTIISDRQMVVCNVEVIQFVQHGDLADSIVVRVSQFQKWKLASRDNLKWERSGGQ